VQAEDGYMNIAINENNVAVMVDEVPENYVFVAGVEHIKEKAQELTTREIRVEDAGLIIAAALDLINPALYSIYQKLKEERNNYEREAGYAQRELDEVKEKLRLLEYDNEKLTSQLLEAQSKACERPYAHLKTENLKSRIESYREMLQDEFSSEMRKSILSKIEEMERELKARLN
jgi:chromosome segregation ATPase